MTNAKKKVNSEWEEIRHRWKGMNGSHIVPQRSPLTGLEEAELE